MSEMDTKTSATNVWNTAKHPQKFFQNSADKLDKLKNKVLASRVAEEAGEDGE